MLPFKIATLPFQIAAVLSASLVPYCAMAQESAEMAPTAVGGEPLAMDDAIAYALSHNPRILAKREELGIAAGELKQASIYFQHNPELSAWIARRHIPGSTNVDRSFSASFDPFAFPPTSTTADLSVSRTESEDHTEFKIEVSQEFEIFGQPKARRDAAVAHREAVESDIARVTWDVVRQTRLTYYRAQIAARRTALLEQLLASVESMRDLSRRRFENGDIARTEYRHMEIQTAHVANELLRARTSAQSANAELNLVLGRPGRASVTLPGDLPNPIPSPPISDTWIEQHPRIEYGRRLTEQREQEAELARRRSRSNVTGSFFWTREEGEIDIVGVGLSVPIPLFNRGQGTQAAARARVTAAQADAIAGERELRARARNILREYAASEEASAKYFEEILPMIEQNLSDVEYAYRAGDVSMVELRVSQRELLETQRVALDTLEQHYRWRAELEALLGRSLGDAGDGDKEHAS